MGKSKLNIEPAEKTRYLSPLLVIIVLLCIFLKPNPDDRLLIRASDLMILGVSLFFLGINFNSLRRIPMPLFNIGKGVMWILLGMFTTIGVQTFYGVKFSVRDLLELYRPAMFFLLVALGWYSAGRIKVSWIITFFACLLGFEILVGLFQRFNIGGFVQSPFSLLYSMEKVTRLGRIVGTMGNPNEYGFLLNMLLMILFYQYFQGKDKRIGQKTLFLLVHGLIIVFSSSRTAILVWGLFACYNGWDILKRSGLKTRILLSALAICAVIVVFVYIEKVLEFLQLFRYVFQAVKTLLSGQSFWEIAQVKSRLVNYENMYEMILQNPILGNGPQKEEIRIGDNDYLFCWTQWGILGMILKYWFFGRLLLVTARIKVSEIRPIALGLLFTLISVFISGLTGESFNNLKYIPMILVLLGFCMAKDYQADHISSLPQQESKSP